MNANELRVGNKVTIDNEVSWSKLKGEVMTVIGVSKITDIERMVLFPKSKYNISLEDCNGNLYHQFDEFIIPIPLSPEILEKCGFENQRYEEWEAFAYKDTAICASWDGVEWVFKYGYDSDLSIASCEFLHQLQNLIYALTGEELTYKQ